MSTFSKEKLNSSLARDEKAKKYTVMVVDDEPINLTLYSNLLSKEYEVITAESGEVALAHVTQMEHPERLALVVSDQRMPHMTGVELFKRLSGLIPKAVMIIVTGYMDYDAVISSINDAQIYKFITKPIEREDFLLTIRRAIEHYEANDQLDQYVKNLEQKIEDRTRSLEQKNIELREAYRTLKRLSVTDQLTGFYNRHYLEEYISRDIDYSVRAYTNWLHNKSDIEPTTSDLTFYLIDIDHFKSVNDHYGHSVGDKFLIHICTIIRSVFRESDLLVRWGGEEFLAISRFGDRHDSKVIATRLKERVEAAYYETTDGATINRTCSIGFANFPFFPQRPKLINWKDIVQIADKALYAAKYSGRNAWVSLESNEDNPTLTMKMIAENVEELVANDRLVADSSFKDSRPMKWSLKK